jgi:hypothetical protein
MGSGAVSSTGSGADNSPPSIAKVKNEWSFTSTPAYAKVLYTGSGLLAPLQRNYRHGFVYLGFWLLWMRKWTFGFHKMWGISWLAENRLDSEGLCLMEQVIKLFWFVPRYGSCAFCVLLYRSPSALFSQLYSPRRTTYKWYDLLLFFLICCRISLLS